MSVPDVPRAPLGSPPERPQGLGGCFAVFLVICGIVLLLPGLCSLVFIGAFRGDGAGSVGLLWVITFVIAFLGILLIRYAVRNR